MASSIFLTSPILLVILFHFLLSTEPICSSLVQTGTIQTGLRVTLTRVRSGQNSPKTQYYSNALSNIRNSLTKLPLKPFKDIYAMNLAIGTPPVSFLAIMDTGSDLIWTKCMEKNFFNSSKSSSFVKVNESCDNFLLWDCKQKYQDGKSVAVTLGQETLTVGESKIPNLYFACGVPTDNKFEYDGIVGMGRGKLSFVSQLNEPFFSYCFGSRFSNSKTSVLLTGTNANNAINANAYNNIQTMPLITNKPDSYYYISLEGISVGQTRLPVTKTDFAVTNGDGGMIIDSGTTFTYLEKRIVNMISDEFMKQTKLKKFDRDTPYGLENCFELSPKIVGIIPKMVFHFSGANWELERENYMYEKNGVGCLAFIANPDTEKVSIFGNMQQQNMMVLYDLDKNSLSFKPADCKQF